MFRNYLATALNNLARNRLYAAITILGLAVAFTVAILVGQFVRNEFSYDRWIPGHERIFKIDALIAPSGQKPILLDAPPGVGPRLATAAGGVAAVARVTGNGSLVRPGPGGQAMNEPALAWADPDIFRVLPLPVLAGDLPTALERPDTVVLTRRMARKYFGRDAPIGATLQMQGADVNWHTVRVTAVLQDLPPDTNLGWEVFASGRSTYSYLRFFDDNLIPGAFRIGISTFARLAPGASPSSLQPALDAAGRPDAAAFGAQGDRMTFQASPLDDLHWQPGRGGTKPRGSKSITYATLAVAGLIVMVAAINFITLMTARAARRGVEVGVRKASGARRRDLVVQFMGEALIQVAIAAMIAAGLAEALVGPFNALVQRSLTVDFLHDPILVPALAGFTLGVGVLASIYPALVLSSFRPAMVLKGGAIRASGSPFARTGLVTIQFAVLVGLILATATIYRQTRFAMARGMGAADSEGIVDIFGGCEGAFPQEVRRLPGVAAAACSTPHALNMAKLAQRVQTGRRRGADFDAAPVDVGLLEIYGVRPLAGRLFSKDHGEDRVLADMDVRVQPTVVINETAAHKLGYTDPRRAVGHQMVWTRDMRPGVRPLTGPSQIIGVVPDLPLTVRAQVDPTFYVVAPRDVSILSVRLTGATPAATLKEIGALWARTTPDRPISTLFLSQFRQNLYLDLTIQGATIAICAFLAILIACLGLYGLSAYMTERRTKEIGIRKAMGAGTRDVILLLLWQFTVPVLCAVIVAMPIGFLAMSGWLRQFAYRAPLSVCTFALAGAVAILIGWLTVSYQSWTVAKAKPAGALQYE